MTDSERALTRRALLAELLNNKQAITIADLRKALHASEIARIEAELKALDAPRVDVPMAPSKKSRPNRKT